MEFAQQIRSRRALLGITQKDLSEISGVSVRTTKLSFHYWQDRGPGQYNYIQLYADPERQSLAIEPMTCPPDVLNNRMGLIELDPGAESKVIFGVRVDL